MEKGQTVVDQSGSHFYLCGDVHTNSVHCLIMRINNYIRTESDRKIDDLGITLHIDSFGGESDASLKFIDYIESAILGNVESKAIVNSTAFSCAAKIFMIFPYRAMTKRSLVMFHQANWSISGNKKETKAGADYLRQIDSMGKTLVMDQTGMTGRKFDSLDEKHINAKEALKLGIIHEILG